MEGSVLLPVRWMSPESVLYGKFSQLTDVWSFGVVVWEVFCLGEQPYAGLTNQEVVELLRKRRTLTPPTNCLAHQLMLDCWEPRTKNRATFSELCLHLSTLLHDEQLQ